jgi:hypothetical protein
MDAYFNHCHRKEISAFLSEYLKSLSSPIDSHLEDHILASQFYKIMGEGVPIGYCAIYKDYLLTQFYLQPTFFKFSQPIFKNILKRFPVKSAYVPTCDEFFLSHALDTDFTLEKQAYFFQDNPALDVSSKIYSQGIFRLATDADIQPILAISGDFFDSLTERIREQQIFVFEENHTLLGAGIIENGKLLTQHASIGMFTHEQHRQKGVGRSLTMYLKKACYERGFIPIAGCWYHNHHSKKTLESAGMLTKTRLLKFNFTMIFQSSIDRL